MTNTLFNEFRAIKLCFVIYRNMSNQPTHLSSFFLHIISFVAFFNGEILFNFHKNTISNKENAKGHKTINISFY